MACPRKKGEILICGVMHMVQDTESVEVMIYHGKNTDQGGGHFGYDRSESAGFRSLTIKMKDGYDARWYEDIGCSGDCSVQYNDGRHVYTIGRAQAIDVTTNLGKGEVSLSLLSRDDLGDSRGVSIVQVS